MIYLKVAEVLYPATFNGCTNDCDWDNRESKSITLTMSHADVEKLLPDNTSWFIVQKTTSQEGNEQTMEWDNSDYSLSGEITDHRDGTATIKMGKPTDLEDAYEMLLGGDSK